MKVLVILFAPNPAKINPENFIKYKIPYDKIVCIEEDLGVRGVEIEVTKIHLQGGKVIEFKGEVKLE